MSRFDALLVVAACKQTIHHRTFAIPHQNGTKILLTQRFRDVFNIGDDELILKKIHIRDPFEIDVYIKFDMRSNASTLYVTRDGIRRINMLRVFHPTWEKWVNCVEAWTTVIEPQMKKRRMIL